MKKKFIVLFILISILFTGCINYKELEQLALLSSIGFSKKNDTYELILKEVTAYKKEDSTGDKYNYYKTTCKKIEDCFQKIKKTTTQTLYYNTVENVVIKTDIYEEIIKHLSEYKELKNTLNENTLIFVTDEDLLTLFKTNKDYKYISNLVHDNSNSLLKIKKNQLEKKKYSIPKLKIKKKDIIKTKPLKVGDDQ